MPDRKDFSDNFSNTKLVPQNSPMEIDTDEVKHSVTDVYSTSKVVEPNSLPDVNSKINKRFSSRMVKGKKVTNKTSFLKKSSFFSRAINKIASLYDEVGMALSGTKPITLKRKIRQANNATDRCRSISSRKSYLKNQEISKTELLLNDFQNETEELYNIKNDSKLFLEKELTNTLKDTKNSNDDSQNPVDSSTLNSSFSDNKKLENKHRQRQGLIINNSTIPPPPPPPPLLPIKLVKKKSVSIYSTASENMVYKQKNDLNFTLKELQSVTLKKVDENRVLIKNDVQKKCNQSEATRVMEEFDDDAKSERKISGNNSPLTSPSVASKIRDFESRLL
ncbi:hypothetical protein HK099_006271 [Clydaea vesicula]|uniref:Uncharacterized protein n=1 Tax=Clydaea vesicula TaxID=447962 RepID=A0AAD5U9R9_9FUNG|nr:hypothetical protein HK099_006271 [Clydaea vesicula]